MQRTLLLFIINKTKILFKLVVFALPKVYNKEAEFKKWWNLKLTHVFTCLYTSIIQLHEMYNNNIYENVIEAFI